MSGKEEEEENNILYELLIYGEWQQEPEIVTKQDKQDERKNIVWNWFGSFVPPCNSKPFIQRLINQQMIWQFAVGGNGQVIAVLQDQSIEIRSSRDDYHSVIGRCQILKDPFPQWRKIVWSSDCSMLAVSFSNGSIEFFDLLGSNLFSIHQAKAKVTSNNGCQDSSRAIAAMIFTEARIQSTQWSSEFLFVTYKGVLYSYFVSPTEGFQENHTFSFAKHYPDGITNIAYHPAHHLLFVSGIPQNIYGSSENTKALHMGITAWRFLSDYPHYKLVTSLEDELDLAKRGWLQMISFLKKYKKKTEDLVFKLSISPSGNLLAAVHTSGALSLWHIPSLRPKCLWELYNQERYNEVNPQYCEPGKRKKNIFLNDPLHYHISDINWWSDLSIIIARYSGAVTVSSTLTFKNLLGSSPEWFEVVPQVSTCNDGGFLILECESNICTKKRSLESHDDITGDESSDEEDNSYITHTSQIMKRALYYVTDSEKFQPPRKRPKILTRTYRLLCLKSTTPEELYSRKIDNEEYGEALALAKAYNLDCDLVYQRQWRKTPVSVASIQDYLSKITKRSWVLHECLERVPENIDAAKELLLYGLRGTDLETLIAIGQGKDHGRFILNQLEYDSNDEYVTDEEEKKENLNEKEANRKKLLEKVNFRSLTLEQKQLCQYRLKLFTYLDRLLTYEVILGGIHTAVENYNHNFFKKFRSQAGFQAALLFAQNNAWEAVSAMFTHHGKETLPHRLAILSNFPETTSPFEYASLLPEAGYGPDDPEVYPWEEVKSREEDWCEIHFLDQITSPSSNEFEIEYYEEHKEYLKYRTIDLTKELLTQWYSQRAREIENLSCCVENALELIKLGRERNVQGLEKLHDDLVIMETLVYECHVDKPLSFQELENMSDNDRLQLLMSMSTESTFIKDVKQWLLPFLQCCNKYKPGSHKELLREYLVKLATEELTNCLKIFESSRVDQPDPIITDIAELMSLALDCVYACKREDQLSQAFGILECLPQRGYGDTSSEIDKLHDRLDELEKYLSVAELLEQHGVSTTLSYLYTCNNNSEEVKKLLIKLTRTASRQTPSLGEAEWKQLLNDILDMQQKIYKCITPVDCYEIFVEALLCSGKLETIGLAARMIECNLSNIPTSPVGLSYLIHHKKLDYSRAVKLVLSAAREYFNSSETPSDPCMNLARECLHLIEDTPPVIEEELDLISSLPLLQEFSINILPLKVRLCENRLEFIKQALKAKPKAYKNSQKLLRLSYFLRVCGQDKQQREGKVLSLIAEVAFEAKDYQDCYNICQQLMTGGHEEGWSICQKMGSCNEFKNIEAKCKLLSFAISHCSPDLLVSLLQIRGHLELQVILSEIKFNLGIENGTESCAVTFSKEEEKKKVSDEDTYKNLWNKGEETLKALHSTTQITKDVLTAFGSKKFWTDVISWIPSLGIPSDDYSQENISNNNNLMKQGVDAFYVSDFQNIHINKFDPDYTRYARQDLPQKVTIAKNVLRAILLKDTLEEPEIPHLNSEVLIDLAQMMISEDLYFSFSLLLALVKEEESERFFSKLPNTAIVLQTALYYYALRLYVLLYPKDILINVYFCDPTEIINQVIAYLTKRKDLMPEATKLSKLIQKYDNMLFDFIQAEVLHGLGGGVDITRFTTDNIYKKETILGLAMTADDSVLNVSISLARHYNIPIWDVYMANIEFMFLEESLSVDDIKVKIEHFDMMEELLLKPILFKEKLQSNIYPSINGKDFTMLIFYYTLLEKCGNDKDFTGIKPNIHLEMLKVLEEINPDLDYKMLTNPNTDVLSILYPVLNENNIEIFTKLATNLIDQNGEMVKPSSVLCIWTQKYFFEGDSDKNLQPKTFSDWINRYEACSRYFEQFFAYDFLEFVNKITFSVSAFENLSTRCRIKINEKSLKYCKKRIDEMDPDDEK
ncbi:NBAS subunit of NRZ tethering complex-like [Centruroides vittatus]|uniref:NBAS subunit of NRZ tethering complex-like n=1 Tax=Centruroides vittatus TaxID=120091 RepID=UPI003510C4F0